MRLLTGLRAAERKARPSEAESVRGTIEVVVENVEDVALPREISVFLPCHHTVTSRFRV